MTFCRDRWRPDSYYSVVYVNERGNYVRMVFDDLSEAEESAKKYNTVVIQRFKQEDKEHWIRRIANVGVAIGVITFLSMVGWGWIYVLIDAGVI